MKAEDIPVGILRRLGADGVTAKYVAEVMRITQPEAHELLRGAGAKVNRNNRRYKYPLAKRKNWNKGCMK